MAKVLDGVKCFLLDMDGTVHISGVPVKGAAEAVERLKKRARVIFLTNNTSRSKSGYIKKLNQMGFKAAAQDVYTAGDAAIDYLKAGNKDKSLYVLGTDSLKKSFIKAGFTINESDPLLVVIGYDTSLTYKTLSKACRFIMRGVPYLLTHPDINCPDKDGYLPDAGAIDALIRTSTKKQPFIICGKPHKPMADAVKDLTGLSGGEIAMVGDRLSTDMRFALDNGFKAVLVLTGEACEKELEESGMKPDLVLDSVASITEYL